MSTSAGIASRLAKTMSRASGVVVASDKELRRYRAVVTSSTQINGKVDVDCKSVVWNIGRRGDMGSGMMTGGQNMLKANIAVQVNDAVKADLNAYARKYTSFPAEWSVFDMAGVVERLAKGMAHYATHGVLSSEVLRGGQEASVVAAGTLPVPIAASSGHVFMPCSAQGYNNPNVVAAMIDAVSGERGTLVTDVLAVSADTNRAILPTAQDEALAVGCYGAIRLLASNYSAHDAGAVFAYAFTRGIHSQVTVYGHTDEGGIMRDVLRRGSFAPPCGGVVVNLPSYVGLPMPQGGLESFQKVVDSAALATAGAVALADPCVSIEGRVYPTVLTSNVKNGEGGAGDEAAGGDDARDLIKKLYSVTADFAAEYARALEHTFGLSGSSSAVVKHMVSVVGSMIGREYAHLRHKCVAPFFWVEPTGVVSVTASDFKAGKEGYAQLCDSDSVGVRSAYDGLQKVSENALSSTWRIDWRSARKHGMMLHLAGHKMDGLAHLSVRQADPHAFALLGNSGSDNNVMSRMSRNDDVAAYLWGRGHSAIIAPSEMLYTGRGIGLAVQHNSCSDDGYDIMLNHCPMPGEMLNEVEFSVSRLDALPVGELRKTPREVVRERSNAARALNGARLRRDGAPMVEVEMPMAFCDLPPEGPNSTKSVMSTDRVGSAPKVEAGEELGVQSTEKLADSAGPETRHGAVLKPSVKHGSMHGPSAGRSVVGTVAFADTARGKVGEEQSGVPAETQ